jgi:hypothetical protein
VSNKVTEFLAGFPLQEVAMNRITRLAFVLSLAATASVAQVSVFSLVPLETGCPIGIRATLEKSRSLFAPQRLELTLAYVHLPVSSLRITAHGVAPVADSPAPSETAETLELNRVMGPRPYAPTEQKQSPKGQGEMAALDDVLGTIGTPVIIRSSNGPQRWYGWVTGFTAVNFIDLDSVSYGDGTSWHASNGKTCRLSLADGP